MNVDTNYHLLDEAERAVQRTRGGRHDSETSFLGHLLRDIGDHVSTLGLSPAELFRAALQNAPLMRSARHLLNVLALPSQQPAGALRPGDWMLRAVPGTGDVGHVAVLASDDLLAQPMLASEGIAAESAQPGQYGLVIETGTFPHSRSQPFFRRVLDSRGRAPPNTVLLRPEYPSPGLLEPMAEEDLEAQEDESAATGWTPIEQSEDELIDATLLEAEPEGFADSDSDTLSADAPFEESVTIEKLVAAQPVEGEGEAVELEHKEGAAEAEDMAERLEPGQFESEELAANANASEAELETLPISEQEAEDPQRDEVDDFLWSRRSLYKVALVGTNVHVTLPRSYEWTARYTNRALTEGAMGAAMSVIYMGNITAEQAKKAYLKVVGHGVKHTQATKQAQGEGAIHMAIIDDAALMKIAEALNLPPKFISEQWRAKYGEAKMIHFALDVAYDNFDKLVPHFSQTQLAASKITVELVRHLLEKRVQSMIEVAKRHPAAAAWRAAYKRNLALHWAEREPVLGDFDKVPLSQWAKTVLDLAATTRNTINEQNRRKWEEDRKHARNEHLRPHEIKVDDAAKFILENFEPTHRERLDPNPWIIHGGQQLTNIKNEPIYLLRVESSRVIFQHLGNQKFYEQTLEGFSQEQLYGIYAAAGEKSHGAIALTKWVIGLAGAVFPPVRYGLLATDVLNAAFKLQANRVELERSYDAMKLAYSNIDALLPGVLPKIWDAVLDKRNVALFNPMQNPDAGAWLKAVIRIVMERQARVARASYVADAVKEFLKKAWVAMKKGLLALWEVVKHVIILAPAVAGSTGVSGQRALDLAQERLRQLGVADTLAIVGQIRQLSGADRERLSRELQDLVNNGTKLMEVIEKSLAW
jgi:hypothetical protein